MGRLPTAEEQLTLQLINRAREDPYAEMEFLFNLNDPDIDSAVRFFGSSEAVALSQVDELSGQAPVAWNADLAESAAIHSDFMIAFDEQSHLLPGEPSLGQRVANAGYQGLGVAENVYAYARNVLYAHAGFYIDWGRGPDGIQDPPGHRDAMLSEDYTEVGIAYEEHSGVEIGPFVTTQHFGRPTYNKVQIVGVVIDDMDGDAFYDIGEGLGGVDITAVGGGRTYTTTTWEAGGYALEVRPNTQYEVTFSGGAFGEARTYDVQVASRNVSRDAVLILGQGQNVSTEGDDILVGTEDDDVINGLGGNDVISAGAGNDIINGGAGDDEIYGEDDNDVLLGGDGDDRFFSEEGFDEIDGGAGLDWMMFEQNVDDVILFRGDDSLAFLVFTEDGSHYDQVKNVEFFAFADQNLSEAQVESIAAGQSTSDAQKTLTTGTSGAETLQGTDEADLIVSGGGALDYLTGLAGADTFVFGDEVGNGMVERDIITDFTEGVDDIDLGGAEVAQVVQTSQGIVVRLEGDGDVIYLDNFGLDLAAATDIFGLT